MSQSQQDDCPKCEEKIKKDKDGIICDGCTQAFHITCVQKNDNIQFICDACQVFCLKTINNKLNGLFDYLFKIDQRSKETNEIETTNATQNKSIKQKNETNTNKQSDAKHNGAVNKKSERETRSSVRNAVRTQKSSETPKSTQHPNNARSDKVKPSNNKHESEREKKKGEPKQKVKKKFFGSGAPEK